MGIKERKQREKDLRRRQILEAAKELFMVKGFFATMEDIANKAELNPATIYRYFTDKDHLHASLSLESLQHLVEKIKEIQGNKRISVESKIRRFKEALYKNYKSDPQLFRNFLQFQLGTDFQSVNRDALNQNNGLYRKLLGMFADVYEEGVRQGKFRTGNKMAHADIILGCFIGLVLWEDAKNRIDPKKDFIHSTLDKAFEIFIEGIKKA